MNEIPDLKMKILFVIFGLLHFASQDLDQIVIVKYKKITH